MFRYIVSALSQLHRGVLICGGFALFMVFGALLLMLPFSTTGNAEVSFVDALFMSVSVVSVTGMSMFDVRTDFTIFGQLVILFLMQVGGLGIMTIMAMVGISTGRKIRLQERLLIRDSFNLQTPSGMVMLVRKIIFMTLLVEFISGTLLAVYFYFKFGYLSWILACRICIYQLRAGYYGSQCRICQNGCGSLCQYSYCRNDVPWRRRIHGGG